MKQWGVGKWGATVVALMFALVLGCAKQQTVKSDEYTAPPGAPGEAEQAQAMAPPPPEGIVAETLKQEPTPPSTSPMQIAAAEAAAGRAATEEKLSPFQDIQFDFDKSFIREDARPILARVADYMKRNLAAHLVIEGHCDERGTAEYNMALGDRRAESARRYLVLLGVQDKALSTVSFGKEKPIDTGHTEEAWSKNRRAHFVLK